MLPCMPRWWNQRRVERKRNETIFAIEGNRVAYEDMLRRAVTAGGVEPRDAADVVRVPGREAVLGDVDVVLSCHSVPPCVPKRYFRCPIVTPPPAQ